MPAHLTACKYDANKPQLYLNNYERFFESLADRNIKLFELGIAKGGSLLMWKDFFKKGQIVGLDLNPVKVEDPTGRIQVYQGDQGDVKLLSRIGAECAPEGFDVIIDDASHVGKLTKTSFWHLFDNYLKPGGLYVIEDWRVGYWRAWPDGAKYKFPNSPANRLKRLLWRSLFPSHSQGMVGLIKQLIDELGMDAITAPARQGTPPHRFPKFQRMEICPGQVFIVKSTNRDHELVEGMWRAA